MKFRKLPSADYVRSRLDYSPETGVFKWKYDPLGSQKWNTRYSGKEAGWRDKEGRLWIRLDDVLFSANRLAVLITTGQSPLHEVDHKNTDPSDDRIENLRPATRQQNAWNRNVRNRGVCFKQGCYWQARLGSRSLGYFSSKEEAIEAYRRAAIEEQGEFVHHSVASLPAMEAAPIRITPKGSIAGVRGVTPHRGRWLARFVHRVPGGKQKGYHLGVFDTIEEASTAYEKGKAAIKQGSSET